MEEVLVMYGWFKVIKVDETQYGINHHVDKEINHHIQKLFELQVNAFIQESILCVQFGAFRIVQFVYSAKVLAEKVGEVYSQVRHMHSQ